MRLKKMLVAMLVAAPVLGAHAANNDAKLPSDWHVLPEEQAVLAQGPVQGSAGEGSERRLAPVLGGIFEANARALDSVRQPEAVMSGTGTRPKDWTPWHLEYFTTDLAVTGQGLVGVLTVKGTPAVQAYWRRQGTRPLALAEAAQPERDVGVTISEETRPEDVSAQVEPAVRAAMATGKIFSEKALRENLRSAVLDFQSLVQAIDGLSASPWWISGFRWDVSVDASGKVYFATIGAEIRLRFEWKRMKRVSEAAAPPRRLSTSTSKFASGLRTFVASLQRDIAEAADTAFVDKGFQGYTFRVGLGVTAGGNFGVAKGSLSTIGQVNFSRDVRKPVVHPRLVAETGERMMLLIESRPSSGHLEFARAGGIALETLAVSDGGDAEQVAYRIDREKFRSGLKKAIRIGSFFAAEGARAQSKGWHVYELKTGFDMSIAGDLGVVKLGGFATAEISFYNQKF